MFMTLCRCRLYGCVIDTWEFLTNDAIVLILRLVLSMVIASGKVLVLLCSHIVSNSSEHQ